MTMINMNAPEFQDNARKIFNGGDAGSVENCSIAVTKKGREDADNKPDYNFIITDTNDGELGKGFYDPTTKSDGAKKYFVKEMNYYARNVFKVPVQDSYNSYGELMTDLMGKFRDSADGIKINVAVGYGTADYPKRFLEIDGYWGIKEASAGVPKLGPGVLTERPAADDEPAIGGNTAKGEGEADTDEEW